MQWGCANVKDETLTDNGSRHETAHRQSWWDKAARMPHTLRNRVDQVRRLEVRSSLVLRFCADHDARDDA